MIFLRALYWNSVPPSVAPMPRCLVGADHRAARVESGEVREREARRFVADAKGWYLDVFDAIVRNGNDRKKSIREIANRRAEEGENN